MDYKRDKNPPAAPDIKARTSVLFFYSFTKDRGSWRNWGGRNGATVRRIYDPARKDYCVESVDEMTSGYGGVIINPKPFDAMKYPLVSFEYKIPKEAKIHLMVHVNGVWRGITLVVPSTYPNFTNIGSANIRPDNAWHACTLNLLQLLKKALPGAKKYKVVYLAIADYYNSYTPAGVPYYIDNFAVVGPSKPNDEFTFSSFDSSGIIRFRYVLNEKSVSGTERGTVIREGKLRLPQLKPGIHYLHVSACDGAGNWGPASHILIFVPKR